jgi:autotransporter-associated beta strand protein
MIRSLPRPAARSIVVAALALAISLFSAPAFGVVSVGGNGNTTAPIDDPGFADVGISSTGGATVTYLGNGWCITANHVTISNTFTHLNINGKYYQITQQIGSSAFGGADLQLFQINGDPGLAPLTISTTSPIAGSQVTMIGNGSGSSGPQYWNVNVPSGWSGQSPGTWTSTTSGGSVTPIPANLYWNGSPVSPGTYQASGLSLDSNHVIRWGQNLITRINQSDGATRYFYTTFNDPTYSPDQTTIGSEAQAVNGDSGGGVFYKVPGVGWQLAGIMYAQGGFPGQAVNSNATAYTGAVFGDISAIVDLSQYRGAIQAIDTPMSWTGQTTSTWDTSATNWASWNSTLNAVTPSNSGGTYYAATFGDKNPLTNTTIANSSITIQAAGVTLPSVVFNNSGAVAYTFSDAAGSTAGISNPLTGGPTAIIKNGAGSVTFLGSNSFSGPVSVNAGRLNLQNSGALGTSSGLTVASGATLELQSNISVGAIPLTITGAGLAANPAGALNNVSGNNSFAGPITIGTGGATINSAFAGNTLTLSGPISLGSNSLTISGGGNASVTNVISGSGGLIKWGNGFLSLNAANTYTGGTSINGGVVVTGSLGDPTGAVTVSAGAGVSTALVLGTPNQTQTAASLSGTVATGGSAAVSIGPTDTLAVNQATNTTFGGSIVNSGNLIKSGAGTLEIDGAPNWGTNGSIQVGGGTLKFNLASGSPTVYSGVTATVSSGATLQLAGSVSALAAGSNLVNVSNDSQAAAGGVLVTGVNQRVGSITGAGSTVVAAGGNLTATSIVQSALVIGGSPGNPGMVTIQASGANGAPASSATLDPSRSSSSDSFLSYLAAGDFSLPFNGLAMDSTSASAPAALSGAGVALSSNIATVPEPSGAVLATLAIAAIICLKGVRRVVARRAAV